MKAGSKPIFFNLPAREASRNSTEGSHIKSGVLDGKPVTVLVDTGSRMSVVRADLVDTNKLSERTAKLECVHGDAMSYRTAQVTLEIGGWLKELSVAVVPKLPVDVLISWDDYISVSETSGITSLAVLTRAQRKKQVEQTPGCVGGDGGVADRSEGNGPATRVTRGPVSQYLLQHPQSNPAQASDEQPDNSTDAQGAIGDVLQATHKELAEWQSTDPTLSKIRDLVSGGEQAKGRAPAHLCFKGGGV